MDIDLKNINMSDIKDQILKLADKKTLIKIAIITGAIIFFLIIYYAILNPMANSRKAKLNDMNLKKQETEQFISDIYSMKAKIKKLSEKVELLERENSSFMRLGGGNDPNLPNDINNKISSLEKELNDSIKEKKTIIDNYKLHLLTASLYLP